MIMGNTPKGDIGWPRPPRQESAGRPRMPELLCERPTHAGRPAPRRLAVPRGPAIGGPGSCGLLAWGGAPRDVPGADGRAAVLEHGLACDHHALHFLPPRHPFHPRFQDLVPTR